jgi:hypothetical protein
MSTIKFGKFGAMLVPSDKSSLTLVERLTYLIFLSYLDESQPCHKKIICNIPAVLKIKQAVVK